MIPPNFFWRIREGEVPLKIDCIVIIVEIDIPRVLQDVTQYVRLNLLPLFLRFNNEVFPFRGRASVERVVEN